MMPAFISTQAASRNAKSKAKTTSKKSSYDKENRPAQRNISKSTKIPGPMKTSSRDVSQLKVDKAKTKAEQDQGLKKRPLAQKNNNACTANTARKKSAVKDENADFQVDPAARKSIITGVSPYINPGKRERNTIGVPFSRRLQLGEPKSPRASFHAGYINGAVKGTSAGLVKKKDKSMTDSKSQAHAVNRKTTNATSSTTGDSQKSEFAKDFQARSKILSSAGPIRRLNFYGMQRNKPYHVDQGKIGGHRKNKEPRMLTFEERLSIILNNRPGLDGDRKTLRAIGKNVGTNFESNIPKSNPNTCPLRETTNRIINENEESKALAAASGPAKNETSGRPKPKLPGQLCEFAYISPRQNRQTGHAGSARKSPCKRLCEIINAKETTTSTPARITPRKITSALKDGPMRYTAEARHNLRNGLPLPPKERRYEFVDPSKLRSAVPKRGNENDPTIVRDSEFSALKDVQSSAKDKKSVRWADKHYNRSSEAHKRLNFDNELYAQPQAVASTSTYNSDLPPSGGIVNTHHTETNIDTKIVNEPARNIKAIPKPFDRGFPNKNASLIAVSEWDSTPDNGRNHAATNVPFVSPTEDLAQLRRAKTRSTPESNAKRIVPHCPAARRTWARTPHAKDEETAREKSLLDNTLDRTVVMSATATSSHLTSLSDMSSTVNPSAVTSSSDKFTNDTETVKGERPEKSDFEKITERILARKEPESFSFNGDELKSKFDLSRGILMVIDDINKWNIKEDIKRVYASKFRRAGVSASSSVSAAKCSPDSHRRSKVTTEYLQKLLLSDESSGTDSKNEVVLSNAGPSANNVDNSTLLRRESDSLFRRLSALPKPNPSSRNDMPKGIVTENTNVVYSTAPLRSNYEESEMKTSNYGAFGPVIVSSHVNSQTYSKAPIANSHGSRQSSLSDISSGYSSLHDTESKIEAIVENFMQPVRKIIDDAFATHKISHEDEFVSKTGTGDQTFRRTRGISSHCSSAFMPIPSELAAEQVSEENKTTLLDTEVDFYTKYLEIAQRMGIRKIATRECKDPVAKILSHGDRYHFIPIED